MKKTLIILGGFVLALVLLSFVADYNYRYIPNKNYNQGEFLKYRAHYGFVSAGYGEVEISKKLYKVNDRICYKMEAYGRSTGSFDFFIRVRDRWRSYIDTSAIIPQKFYRHIEEGKYRKTEEVYYHHEQKQLRVIDKKRDIDKNFNVPENVQDLVSGFYYLRNYDMKGLRKNDTINIPAFLEDEVYKLQLVYRGKGVVKNKLGKINALKFTPIMPENSLFDGEESIRVWISNDMNKIPVKIEADMFIGAVELDLEVAEGLRHTLNKVK